MEYKDKNGKTNLCWQTSWGLSTRTIGALIMVHADDRGLVLPPKIAPVKVVIVPIWSDETKSKVSVKANEVKEILERAGIKEVEFDERNQSPGEKFYYWERKGVPLRIEIGPKDIAKNSVILVRRDTGEKSSVLMSALTEIANQTLEEIQQNLFRRALKFKENKTKIVDTWEDFVREINNNNFVLAHFCRDEKIERKIKRETKATIRAIPFDQKLENGKCVYSGKPSEGRVLFARAY